MFVYFSLLPYIPQNPANGQLGRYPILSPFPFLFLTLIDSPNYGFVHDHLNILSRSHYWASYQLLSMILYFIILGIWFVNPQIMIAACFHFCLQIWIPSNPRGAERLPPAIIEAESDFYLRRLWGQPSEVTIIKWLVCSEDIWNILHRKIAVKYTD